MHTHSYTRSMPRNIWNNIVDLISQCIHNFCHNFCHIRCTQQLYFLCVFAFSHRLWLFICVCVCVRSILVCPPFYNGKSTNMFCFVLFCFMELLPTLASTVWHDSFLFILSLHLFLFHCHQKHHRRWETNETFIFNFLSFWLHGLQHLI